MKQVKQYDLEIWPGLKYSIKRINGIPMLNLDTDYMIVRLETAFDLMQDIKKDLPLAGKVELQNEIRRQFKGKVVVTRYNSALYRIKDVDFTQSPDSQFVRVVTDPETGRKAQVKQSHAEYILEKYGKQVQNMEQPLLVTESSADICLIPEFSMMTGI